MLFVSKFTQMESKMKEAQVYKTLPLNGSENGTLKFAVVTEPYGEKSQTIVSICASIDDTQSWKIHLPLCQIKDICKALKESKKAYKKHSKEAKKAEKKQKKEQSCEQKDPKERKKKDNKAKQ